MTVKELKEKLEVIPDNIQVRIMDTSKRIKRKTFCPTFPILTFRCMQETKQSVEFVSLQFNPYEHCKE